MLLECVVSSGSLSWMCDGYTEATETGASRLMLVVVGVVMTIL